MSLNTLAFSLPEDLQTAFEATLQDWQINGKSDSDRAFCIRPDEVIKAARTMAYFCRLQRTTRKI